MNTQPNTTSRPSFRPNATQGLLAVIAALLALNLIAETTGTSPSLASTAIAQASEDGQGLVSAASQRKQMVNELRAIGQKLQALDKKLSAGVNVKVTSMPGDKD